MFKIHAHRFIFLFVTAIIMFVLTGNCDAAEAAGVDVAKYEARYIGDVTVEAPPKPKVVTETVTETFYDIPLDRELQRYTIKASEANGIDPVLVFAVIKAESEFDPDLVGDYGNSVGLMQIQEQWHWPRMERLDVDDLQDPFGNVTVGIDILAEKMRKGNGLDWALMAYNGGHTYADSMMSEGLISDYAVKVKNNMAIISGQSYEITEEIRVNANEFI